MVDGQTGPSGDNVQRLVVLARNKEIEAAPIHLHLRMVAIALVTRLSSNRVTMEPAQVNTHKTKPTVQTCSYTVCSSQILYKNTCECIVYDISYYSKVL